MTEMPARRAPAYLVTGATGLLGAAVVERLLRDASATSRAPRLYVLVRDPARWRALASSRIASGSQ